MPTYNEQRIQEISDYDYVLGQLKQKNQPQFSVDVPPEYEETSEEKKYSNLESYKMSEIRENEEVQRRLQNVARHFDENKGALATMFELGTEDAGEEIDFFEYMRDEQNKLPVIINNSSILGEAPQDVVNDYLFLQDVFNRSEVDTYYERYAQIADFTGDMISDPFNFIGLLAAPFSGGTSAAATMATKQLAKKGIQAKLLANLAKYNPGKKAIVGASAAEAGAFTGISNYYEQSRDINTGLLEQEDVDLKEVAAMTAGGAALGATIVGTVLGAKPAAKKAKEGFDYLKDIVKSKIDEKNATTRSVDTDTMHRTLDEAPLEGEVLGKEQLTYDPEDFTKVEGDFIEGVFEVINKGDVDTDDVVSMVKDFVKKNGGGEATEHRLIQSMLGPKVTKKSKGAIAEGVARAARTLTKLPAYYGGKVSTLLDPYTKMSRTISSLQKRFRYDKQRNTFGDRVMENSDYSEVLGETYGKYYVAVKTLIDPLLQGTYGKKRDVMFRDLSNVIRGQKSDDAVTNVVGAKIRTMLTEAGEELKANGLYDEAKELTANYFPRLWDRRAIEKNRDVFKTKLIQVGEAKDNAEAERIVDEMLDIKFQYGDEGSNVGGNSFLSTRKFEFKDDTVFEDFLNNDTQEVLTSYFNQISRSLAKKKVFGATNFKDFSDLYMDQIKKEVIASGESSKTAAEAQNALRRVWKAQTGDGIEPHNKYLQIGVDAYSTVTRVGLLPLAALNSLSEIMLNITRGGLKSTAKGAAKAVAAGTRNITYGMVDRLVKNHNLTRSEAFLEMNRFGIALDQATADQVERLSGEGLKNFQKFNRTFFRATGLEPWTKVVQLTSFNVGRDIVATNLKSIANAVKDKNGKYSNYVQTQIDQLKELNIDLDEGLRWVEKTGGDLSKDTEFNFKIDRAAARYTNEIILNPTRESGLRSVALSGNPATTMLFQLTAYPAAFTNTILKDLVQRTGRAAPRGDFRTTARVAETAMAMLGTAAFTNYVKQGLFTKDDQFKFKTDEELVFDAITRVGGFGFYFDALHRAKKAADISGSAPAAFAGLFGPVASDVVRSIEKGSVTAALPSKLPLYAAWPKELRREATKEIIEAGQLERKDDRRVLRKTGGEVTDVPRVPTEPDERVDKMTGMPYDKQAGEAFIDAEDPLRRMGFVTGSLVKPIVKPVVDEVADLIARFSPVARKDPDAIQEAADELRERGIGQDPYDLERIQASLERRNFVDPEDVDEDIDVVLDATNLRETPEESLSDLQGQRRSVEEGTFDDIDDPYITGISPENESMMFSMELNSLREDPDPVAQETGRLLNKMLLRMPATQRAKVEQEVAKDRPERIKEFVKDSVVKKPVFRATGHGLDADFEINFAMPREIGTHFGTKGQADDLMIRDHFDYEMGYAERFGVEPEDLYDEGAKVPGRIPAITKGYLNITNPLEIKEDFGNWSAQDIIGGTENRDVVINNIAKQTKKPVNEIKRQFLDVLGPAFKKYKEVLDNTELKNHELQIKIRESDLNAKLRDFIKSQGFDGIKYINTMEDKLAEDFSYIAFDPQQYKIVTASQFDRYDPRVYKNQGGIPKGKRIVGETEDYYLINYGSGSIPKKGGKVLQALRRTSV